jgi:hypothetical protein
MGRRATTTKQPTPFGTGCVEVPFWADEAERSEMQEPSPSIQADDLLFGSKVHRWEADGEGEGADHHQGVPEEPDTEQSAHQETGEEEKKCSGNCEGSECGSGVGATTTPEAQDKDGDAEQKRNWIHEVHGAGSPPGESIGRIPQTPVGELVGELVAGALSVSGLRRLSK